MKPQPHIFVINRAQDTDRAKFIEQSYAAANLNFSFFQATDGHGDINSLKPYAHLIPDQFWRDDDIKLGAFACYISHYRLWQKIVGENIHHAIIAEDDSAPCLDFEQKWANIQPYLEQADITLINNRTSALATDDVTLLSDALETLLNGGMEFRAPGADAYVITRNGAKQMISFSEKFGVFCGVDWALIANAWDTREMKMRDLKINREMKLIYKEVGKRPNNLMLQITKDSIFKIDKKFNSRLNHAAKIPIKELKKITEKR